MSHRTSRMCNIVYAAAAYGIQNYAKPIFLVLLFKYIYLRLLIASI